MRIVTARDLGALVRERRRAQSLTQEDLARRVGVSRRWIIGLEQGQARAFELVLRTLAVLGLAIAVVGNDDDGDSVDLDDLLSHYGPGA